MTGSSGKILLQDDFSDSKSGWVERDLGDVSFKYENGAYKIAFTKGGLNSFGVWPKSAYENVSIEADATMTDGANNNVFGLICRAKAATVLENGYEFVITPGGDYGLLKIAGPGAGQTQLIGKEDQSSAIHTGNGTNHLRADCAGNRLAFYINGQQVLSEQDSQFTSGQVGFAVAYDNFLVREAGQ